MAALHDLIAQVADARLRERITAEWTKATRERKFGLARFAERHGGQFGRIQLIRKRRTAGGGAQIVRLEINRRDAWQQVLLVTTATQLDRLFHGDH